MSSTHHVCTSPDAAEAAGNARLLAYCWVEQAGGGGGGGGAGQWRAGGASQAHAAAEGPGGFRSCGCRRGRRRHCGGNCWHRPGGRHCAVNPPPPPLRPLPTAPPRVAHLPAERSCTANDPPCGGWETGTHAHTAPDSRVRSFQGQMASACELGSYQPFPHFTPLPAREVQLRQQVTDRQTIQGQCKPTSRPADALQVMDAPSPCCMQRLVARHLGFGAA